MTPPFKKDGADIAPVEDAVVLSPVWEQKSVAVLAIELTFPMAPRGKTATDELWTAASRWEETLVAKVQGFGGVLLQRSPSLLLVVFGIPQTLEQLPQRAVQAALTLQTLVSEGSDGEPCPELRQAVHGGQLLVDVSPAIRRHDCSRWARYWPCPCGCWGMRWRGRFWCRRRWGASSRAGASASHMQDHRGLGPSW